MLHDKHVPNPNAIVNKCKSKLKGAHLTYLPPNSTRITWIAETPIKVIMKVEFFKILANILYSSKAILLALIKVKTYIQAIVLNTTVFFSAAFSSHL
jgi:2-polyprenyl-3-methyl-5-hydroxy-6-metoxy-1,4-benzoquinol methylase